MRHSENDATHERELSVLLQELKLLKDRIESLEASVFGSPWPQNPALGTVDTHDAHITVQSQQGGIAIAIRSPSKASTSSTLASTATTPSHASESVSDAAAIFTSKSHQPAIFGNPSPSPKPTSTAPPPTPILTAPPLTPIPFVPSQTTSSWGLMMTPDEVKELLAQQPQYGDYYVVTKGRRPGVYLSWADVHELVDGLRNPCHWKKFDKYAALGQYTIAYQKGACEYRFQ